MASAKDMLRHLAQNKSQKKSTPAIPQPPANATREMRDFMAAVKERVESGDGVRGNGMDSHVTWRELAEAGVVTIEVGAKLAGGAATGLPTVKVNTGLPPVFFETTTPAVPTGVAATSGILIVIVSWDISRAYNHDYAEVWASQTDNVSSAALVGTAEGAVFAHSAEPGVTWFYWVRFVSRIGLKGPFSDPVSAAASQDPAWMIEQLSGQLSESEFSATLNSRIDLIDAPDTGLIDITAGLSTDVENVQTTLFTEATGLVDRMGVVEVDLGVTQGELAVEVHRVDVNVFESGIGLIAKAEQNALSNLEHLLSISKSRDAAGNANAKVAELTTEVAKVKTDLESEITTRTTLEARLDDAQALIAQVQTARATSEEAFAKSLTDLQASVIQGQQGALGRIESEQTVRATQDSAIATSVTNLSSTVSGNYTTLDAAIQTEATTRANKDEAFASNVLTLTATSVNTNGEITAEGILQSLLDNDVRNDQARDAQVRVAVAEQSLTTVANDVKAEAEARLVLASQFDNSIAAIEQKLTTQASASDAFASYLTTLGVSFDDGIMASVNASIALEQSVRASADGALSSSITQLSTQINDPTTGLPKTRADLTNNYYTKTQTDGAISSASTTLTASYNSADTATLNSAKDYADTQDATTLNSANAYVQNYAYSKASTDGAISAAGTTLTTAYQSADSATLNAANQNAASGDSATLTSAEGYVQEYAYSKSAADSAIASSATTLTTAYQSADSDTLDTANANAAAGDSTTLTNAQGYVQTYAYSKAQADSAISTAGSTLTTEYQSADAQVLSDAESYVQTYAFSKSDATLALASESNSLGASFSAITEENAEAILQNVLTNEATGRAILDNGQRVAAIETTTTALADALHAEVEQRTLAVAQVAGATAALDERLTLTATAAESSAREISTLGAQFEGEKTNTRALVQTEATSRATADSALSTRTTTIESTISNPTAGLSAAHSRITTEETTRANKDEAYASNVLTLSAKYSDDFNNADGQLGNILAGDATARAARDAKAKVAKVVESVTVVANALTAEVTARETLIARMEGVESTILDLEKAKVTKDEATAYELEAMRVSIAGNLAQIQSEQSVRATADLVEASARQTLATDLDDLSTNITNNYYTKTTADGAMASAQQTLSANYRATTNKTYRQATAPVQSQGSITLKDGSVEVYNNIKDGDLWIDSDDNNKPYRWESNAWAAVQDGAIGVVDARVTTVETTKIGYCVISGAASNHTTKSACETAGGTWNVGIPMATAVKQVSVTDANGNTAAVEQAFTAQKTLNDTLKAQYTVKVDVNGYVSGFGLATTANNGIPTSEFTITADKFSIAPVATNPASEDGSPFFYLTSPTTINGVSIPAGAYMKSAYIHDATITTAKIQDAAITNAKIVDLNADKITAGTLDAARIAADSITAGMIDSRGLSIKDSSGNVILSAGAIDGGTNYASNLINLAWWNRGATIPWGQNAGTNALYSTGTGGDTGVPSPKGDGDAIWFAHEHETNGDAGGGWGSQSFQLDPAKTHRFVVPVRAYNHTGGGTVWWGTQNVCDLNTSTVNTNPYFLGNYAKTNLSTDRWYLMIGYVFPAGSTGNNSDGAGLWDCKTGQKVQGGTNWTHNDGSVNHRAYQYYAGQGAMTFFGRPMINVVDGSEPSLREYFESGAVLNQSISINSAGQLLGAGGGQVTVSGLGIKTYRILTRGNSSSTHPGADPGFYVDGTLTVGVSRSYMVEKINRSTGVLTQVGTYDVFGDPAQATTMAAALNAIGNDHIVVVYSFDEPQANRLSNGLEAAMLRHGASKAVFSSIDFKYRSAYALVGIGACGEGNGAEFYQGAVGNDANAWIDGTFIVKDGNILGVTASYTPKSLRDYGFSGAMDATRNTVSYGASTPSNPVAGDIWVRDDLSPAKVSMYNGSSWLDAGNVTTNTNQLTDGAELGKTAVYASVSGTPTSLSDVNSTEGAKLGGVATGATKNIVTSGVIASRPDGSDGDFYYATDENKLYQKVSGSWVLSGTVGAPAGTTVGGTDAATVASLANDVPNKLSKNSDDTISSVLSISDGGGYGFRAGDLVWDSTGARTSGSGVAMTPGGLVGYNGATKTFEIKNSDGSAYFGGTLKANVVKTNSIEALAITTGKVANESITAIRSSTPAAFYLAESSDGHSAWVGTHDFSFTAPNFKSTMILTVTGQFYTNPSSARHCFWYAGFGYTTGYNQFGASSGYTYIQPVRAQNGALAFTIEFAYRVAINNPYGDGAGVGINTGAASNLKVNFRFDDLDNATLIGSSGAITNLALTVEFFEK